MKLKENQDRTYDLLCLIDDICKKESLPYFLDGGTEIGAVREKDIIPWDDDIDIKMRWKDYPRFRDAMRKNLPEGILLVEPADFAPRFYDFTTRIVDTHYLRRRVTEEDLAYQNLQNYVCVDVFLHYHIPDNQLARLIAKTRIKFLYGLGFGHRYAMDYTKYIPLQRIPVFLMRFVGHFISPKWICQRFNHIAENCDQKNAASSWTFSTWVLAPSEQKAIWYESSTEGELRGRKFPIPALCDEDLTALYGDYMHPPQDRNAFIQHLDEEDRWQGEICS